MVANPYLLSEPAGISFSGGRTSGMMLYKIIEAYDGQLPDDVHCLFANTGKERPETLDFVQECSTRWNVPITWLEFDPDAEHKTRIVNHNSAARAGEPFTKLIREDRQYLPNPVTRFCTAELKVRRFSKFMQKIMGYDVYESAIGLRFDEAHRVLRLRNSRQDKADRVFPLFDAKVTKRDVGAFWAAQPFDLRLPNIKNKTPHGNCDLCFLKSRKTIEALIFERPEVADWWIEMESLEGDGTFRKDRPTYKKMLKAVQDQGFFEFGDEDGIDCFCTD